MTTAMMFFVGIIWIGLGLLGSYIGYRYMLRYGWESFWKTPFYMLMSLSGPINLILTTILYLGRKPK